MKLTQNSTHTYILQIHTLNSPDSESGQKFIYMRNIETIFYINIWILLFV